MAEKWGGLLLHGALAQACGRGMERIHAEPTFVLSHS